ncbi:hypothetical protein LXA43DRAFT_907146 [Ganoderma leucocontextum]|nr:hypothetical protein LXA43DRAFT_907146 [Ganoderma leucocontextum]
MCLVGVIPGPTKPSTSQINHFLALVVDDFLEFWQPGVFYSRTSRMPKGRLALAALVPLICDLLAARQLSGLGPHNHTYTLCSLCHILQGDIEETDMDHFQPRDPDAHRVAALAWRDAESTLEREELFRQNGIRYSELLRLPYWNPVLYVVVDSMHNLYLGLLQHHIRNIWGINVKSDDGEAAGSIASRVLRPSDGDMDKGLDALLYGSKEALLRCKKAVLYHLCADRDLRLAGTSAQLVRNLLLWRRKEGLPVERSLHEDATSASTARAPPRAPLATSAHPSSIVHISRTSTGVPSGSSVFNQPLDIPAPPSASAPRSTRDPSEHHSSVFGPPMGNLGPGQVVPLPVSGAGSIISALETRIADGERALWASAAIGRTTLDSFIEDRERMELPSWINAAPAAFGTTQHGKLSADQWRTVAAVNLPITLIRTWGNVMDDLAQAFEGTTDDWDDLRMRMLCNFLDLVDAVETIGQLQIDDREIEHAEGKFVDYLEGLKALYKHAKFRPNHHLALHLGVFARLFGPVHAWRVFAFERLNYMYQTVNSSKIFGDMETAFLLSSCRAANFRPLLRSAPVMATMQEFVALHNKLSGEERRGMRFDDIFRSLGVDHPRGDPGPRSQRVTLDDAMVVALRNRLNLEIGQDFYTDAQRNRTRTPQVVLSREAIVCTRVAVAGVFYKTSARSRGDSHVICSHAPQSPSTAKYPARIEHIILFDRRLPEGGHIEETFLFVKRLLPLSATDSRYDPFRRFPRVGGYLCYDRYAHDLQAVRPTDLVCHFAKTRMDHLEVKERIVSDGQTHLRVHRFEHPCTHVLPLDRVSQGHIHEGEGCTERMFSCYTASTISRHRARTKTMMDKASHVLP